MKRERTPPAILRYMAQRRKAWRDTGIESWVFPAYGVHIRTTEAYVKQYETNRHLIPTAVVYPD